MVQMWERMWESTCGLNKAKSADVSDHCRLHPIWSPSHGGAEQQVKCPQATISKLPDEILLGIFGFYMAYPLPPPSRQEDAWHTLVHVCRRWRYVVFGSPRRLNLRLLCMHTRPLKTLDIWPELPIVVHVDDWKTFQPPSFTDVISVLKRHDRVCKIFISITAVDLRPLLKELATSEPFPALIELELASFGGHSPILPDSFLGGSAPRMQSLCFRGIQFPGIRKLLLSTRDLVTLTLDFSRDPGYVSPEAMVDTLSILTRLKSLQVHLSPQRQTHGASQHPPVLTRVILPALTTFEFGGHSKYLGDMVSRIDAPLDCIDLQLTVTLSDQNRLAFDIPPLRDFIWRTKLLDALHRADTSFSDYNAGISLFQRKGGVDFKVFNLEIPFFESSSRLVTFAQACSSLLLPLPSLEHLSIYKPYSGRWRLRGQNEVGGPQWMKLLRLFVAVKNLVLDEPALGSVASALQELVGERVTEVLPALQNIFLVGSLPLDPVPECIGKFIAARELSGRPVVVRHQKTKE